MMKAKLEAIVDIALTVLVVSAVAGAVGLIGLGLIYIGRLTLQ